ncbi:hypothetical protein HPP92_017563 [Vanilla planifolia]|uniref:Bromodomain associated domain-containing protein n=1 Tax=Vanilla planifolia TaxID=51239 RepID=A0A835QG83_VANPL|nr:hypothetical protein HPP92_017563 [Vanilla planifolia]
MNLLLGEDGRGYELARLLESRGAWRSWLGDTSYASFVHSLSSPAAWDSFMTSSPSVPRSQLQLQLRVRALLFDKASSALFLRPSPAASTATLLSNLNPSYLQLRDDDVYYLLEDEQQDGFQPQTPSRLAYSPHRTSQHSFERVPSVGSRNNDPEHVNTSKYEDLPSKCYKQYVERNTLRHHKSPYGDKESHRRTSEGMSMYLKLCRLNKRKRQALKEDHPSSMLGCGSSMHSNGLSEGNNSTEEDISFFPEFMFPANCVPESALPLVIGEKIKAAEVYGVLDNLPALISPSPEMMERFGIRPEYVKMGNKYRGKNGSGGDNRSLSREQASVMSQKATSLLLSSVGFDGGTEASVKVFSEFFCSHLCKLGGILKLLTDSYKKQYSSIELLKMFLQISCQGNVVALTEITKNSKKGGFTQQIQHTVTQHQPLQQNPLIQAQQVQLQRQMHPQLNMLHPQNMPAFQSQQQLEKMRRRQVSTPRGSMMIMDKDQPMADVKIENMMEGPIDANTFNALSKQQMQLRQQQMAMANHNQSSQHFKQLQQSLQIPMQAQLAQNVFNLRTPVKVEAFHELMGEDSTLKHEADQSKLTSTQK